jgi:hypothetical protein
MTLRGVEANFGTILYARFAGLESQVSCVIGAGGSLQLNSDANGSPQIVESGFDPYA